MLAEPYPLEPVFYRSFQNAPVNAYSVARSDGKVVINFEKVTDCIRMQDDGAKALAEAVQRALAETESSNPS